MSGKEVVSSIWLESLLRENKKLRECVESIAYEENLVMPDYFKEVALKCLKEIE